MSSNTECRNTECRNTEELNNLIGNDKEYEFEMKHAKPDNPEKHKKKEKSTIFYKSEKLDDSNINPERILSDENFFTKLSTNDMRANILYSKPDEDMTTFKYKKSNNIKHGFSELDLLLYANEINGRYPNYIDIFGSYINKQRRSNDNPYNDEILSRMIHHDVCDHPELIDTNESEDNIVISYKVMFNDCMGHYDIEDFEYYCKLHSISDIDGHSKYFSKK